MSTAVPGELECPEPARRIDLEVVLSAQAPCTSTIVGFAVVAALVALSAASDGAAAQVSTRKV